MGGRRSHDEGLGSTGKGLLPSPWGVGTALPAVEVVTHTQFTRAFVLQRGWQHAYFWWDRSDSAFDPRNARASVGLAFTFQGLRRRSSGKGGKCSGAKG